MFERFIFNSEKLVKLGIWVDRIPSTVWVALLLLSNYRCWLWVNNSNNVIDILLIGSIASSTTFYMVYFGRSCFRFSPNLKLFFVALLLSLLATIIKNIFVHNYAVFTSMAAVVLGLSSIVRWDSLKRSSFIKIKRTEQKNEDSFQRVNHELF